MAGTFKFFKDSGLAQEFVPGVDKIGPVTSGSYDGTLWLGSNTPSRQLRAKTNPGTDPVQVTINDGNPGNLLEVTHVKLATTQLGLDAAVAGAALDLAAVIASGVGNAAEVWVRVEYPGSTAYDDQVTLEVSADETAV